MAYSPIAFTAPNYRDYKNEWIKPYEPGTTTPKAMATDSTIATLISKAQLNKDGFIVSAGDALIIPYIDGAYDLWLFPTAAEADSNDTSNALRIADNITGVNGDIISNRVPFYAKDLDEAVNETNTKIAKDGNLIYLEERTAGNGGGALWKYVLASSVTPNTFNIVACTGAPTLALALAELPKSTPKQWGAIGVDGTYDDFPALEAYMSYFFDLGSSNEIVIGTANLDSGANYGIDGRLHLLNINVNGNGAQFTPLNVNSGLRISGTRMTHKDYRCIFNGQQSDPLAEAIIYGDTARQCSKNTFIEINTRNAYRGAVAKTSNLTLFGNAWINCRCDNSWDWQWHMQMMQGSTSNTWVNSHARGFLAGGGSPKGFYGENSTEFNFIGNFAVDQVRDGEAMQIVNSQVVNIDILGLESCEIKSASGYLARFGAATVNIGVVSTKVGLFQPGVGNEAYIVQFDGTTASATINHVDNNQEQAGRTGDLYKVRNNNSTKLKCLTVGLDDIQTSGNYQNVINLGDIEGYSNNYASLPASSGARKEFKNRVPTAGQPASWIDDGSDLQIGSIIHGGERVTATTAQLESISDVVNTKGKWQGKQIFNTTTGAPVYAGGSSAGSTWKNALGANAHTPS